MRLAAVALLLVAAACDTRVTDTGGFGSQRPSATITALVGRWSFTRYFEDAGGSVHLSTTVWEFAPGGAATRTVFADNVTAGIGDAVVTTGVWSADARTLSVRFSGSSVPVQYEYRFEGGALILGGLTFVRLSS